MGIPHAELTHDLGRHLDEVAHLFEEPSLPIRNRPGDEGKPLIKGGKPVRSGQSFSACGGLSQLYPERGGGRRAGRRLGAVPVAAGWKLGTRCRLPFPIKSARPMSFSA